MKSNWKSDPKVRIEPEINQIDDNVNMTVEKQQQQHMN